LTFTNFVEKVGDDDSGRGAWMYDVSLNRSDLHTRRLLVSTGDELLKRLEMAKHSDLEALLGDLKLHRYQHYGKTDAELIEKINSELRSAAGNSLMNVMLRRKNHEFSYKQILVDVADKLAPGIRGRSGFKASGPATEVQIEAYIDGRIRERVVENLKKMSEVDKKKLQDELAKDLRSKKIPEESIRSTIAMIASGTFTGVALGPAVAALLYGSVWSAIFGFSLAQLLVSGLIVGGPVSILIAGIAVVSAPSYSKTIPAVYRLIKIRENAAARGELERL